MSIKDKLSKRVNDLDTPEGQKKGAYSLKAVAEVHSAQGQALSHQGNRLINQRNSANLREGARLANLMEGERTQSLISAQRAAIAKSGVQLEGSPLLLLEESAALGSINQQLNTYNAETQAQLQDFQANMNQNQAKQARTAGYLNAATSLIQGYGSLNNIWSKP